MINKFFKRGLMLSLAVIGAMASLAGIFSASLKHSSTPNNNLTINKRLLSSKRNINHIKNKQNVLQNDEYMTFFSNITSEKSIPSEAILNSSSKKKAKLTSILKVYKTNDTKTNKYLVLMHSEDDDNYLFSYTIKTGYVQVTNQIAKVSTPKNYKVFNMFQTASGDIYIQKKNSAMFTTNAIYIYSSNDNYTRINDINFKIANNIISNVIGEDSFNTSSAYIIVNQSLYYYNASNNAQGKDPLSFITSFDKLWYWKSTPDIFLKGQINGKDYGIYDFKLDYKSGKPTSSLISKSQNIISHFTDASNNKITYLGTDDGHLLIVSNSKLLQNYIMPYGEYKETQSVTSIYKSIENVLYVGTSSDTVRRANDLFATSQINSNGTIPNQSLIGRKLSKIVPKVNSIYESKSGYIYIATSNGVYYSSTSSATISQYKFLDINDNYNSTMNFQNIFQDNENRIYITASTTNTNFYVYSNTSNSKVNFQEITEVSSYNLSQSPPKIFNGVNNQTYITTTYCDNDLSTKLATYSSVNYINDILNLKGASKIDDSTGTIIIKKAPNKEVSITPSKSIIDTYTVTIDGHDKKYNSGEQYQFVPNKKTKIKFVLSNTYSRKIMTNTFWFKSGIDNNNLLSSKSLITGYKTAGNVGEKIVQNKDVYFAPSDDIPTIDSNINALSTADSYYTKLDTKTMAEGSKTNFVSITTFPTSGIFHIYVSDVLGYKSDFYLEIGSNNLKLSLINDKISLLLSEMKNMRISLYNPVSVDQQPKQAIDLKAFVSDYKKAINSKLNSYLNPTEYKKILKGYSPSNSFKPSSKLLTGFNYLKPIVWNSKMNATTMFNLSFDSKSYYNDLHSELYTDFENHHGGATPDNYKSSNNTDKNLYFLLILLAIIPIGGLVMFLSVRYSKKHKTLPRPVTAK